MDVRTALQDAIEEIDRTKDRLRQILDELDNEGAIRIRRQGTWTKAMVEQLWREVVHLPGVAALFEVCAEHPGEDVTYSAVLARSGLDPMQQKNEHARLSRVATELFGDKRWPIENWQGPLTSAGGKAEMIYRMPAEVAAWWRDAAGR